MNSSDEKPTLSVVPDEVRNYGNGPMIESQEQLEELAAKIETEGVPSDTLDDMGEITPEKLAELEAVLNEQNNALLGRLQLAGRGVPSPFHLLRLQIATLADFVFPDDGARKQFEVACLMALNNDLKVNLAKAMGLSVPQADGQ